jgi:hypothetical protein
MPKISELTSAGTLTGTEVFPIVQSSTTVKTTIDDVVTYVASEAGGEPNIAKSTGYLTWDGTDWMWKNETYAQPSQNNTYTAAQRGAFVALTSTSASIAVDLDDSNNFNHTLTEDTTLAAPTNAVAGQSGIMIFEQGSGEFALDCDPFWRFPITCPSISGDEGELAVLSYIVGPGATYALCSWGEAFVSCPG